MMNESISGSGLSRGIKKYLTDVPYLLAILITAAGAYGYFIVNRCISVDGLSDWRYLDVDFLCQGRFTAKLLTLLVPSVRMVAMGFWRFFAIMLLCFGAMLLCVLLDRFCHETRRGERILFSCILIAHPIYTELFSYNQGPISVGLGYMMTAFSLWLVTDAIEDRRILKVIPAIVLLILSISWYETVAPVYLCAMFLILLLREDNGDGKGMKSFLLRILAYIGVLLAAIVLEELIAGGIVLALGLHNEEYANNYVCWSLKDGLPGVFKWLVRLIRLIAAMLYSGRWYYPIGLTEVMLAALLIMGIVHAVRKRSAVVFLCYAGMMISAVALDLYRGDLSSMRMNQCWGLVTAGAACAALNLLRPREASAHGFPKWAYRCLCVVLGALVLSEAIETDRWLELNEERFQVEVHTCEAIGDRLNREFDVREKPVVFLGQYQLPAAITERTGFDYRDEDIWTYSNLAGHGGWFVVPQYPQNTVDSYIAWGMDAFSEGSTELLLLFHQLGYDFRQGTPEQRSLGWELARDMDAYPYGEYIREFDDFIAVKMGEY